MAVSLKHNTLAVGTDAGNGEIAKDEWNEEHAFTMATGKLLGRYSASTGAVQEITISTGLSLDGSGNLTSSGGSGISLAEARRVASLRI